MIHGMNPGMQGVYLGRGVRSECQRHGRIYRGNLEGGSRSLKIIKHMKNMIFMISQTHLPNVSPWMNWKSHLLEQEKQLVSLHLPLVRLKGGKYVPM